MEHADGNLGSREIPVRGREHWRLAGVEPIGVGTPGVESLTGYLQRVANEHVVPPVIVLRDVVVPYVRSRAAWPGTGHQMWESRARDMDGFGKVAWLAVEILSEATGRDDLESCTHRGLLSWKIADEDSLLVRRKRWCLSCWQEDDKQHSQKGKRGGSGRYERKLWTLSVVDACPVHSELLMDRCVECGRNQPAISPDVRVGVCGLCGASLRGGPPIGVEAEAGSDGRRRLWFARQAAALIHGLDLVDLYGISMEVMDHDRTEWMNALLDKAREAEGVGAVAKEIERWNRARARVRLEDVWVHVPYGVIRIE